MLGVYTLITGARIAGWAGHTGHFCCAHIWLETAKGTPTIAWEGNTSAIETNTCWKLRWRKEGGSAQEKAACRLQGVCQASPTGGSAASGNRVECMHGGGRSLNEQGQSASFPFCSFYRRTTHYSHYCSSKSLTTVCWKTCTRFRVTMMQISQNIPSVALVQHSSVQIRSSCLCLWQPIAALQSPVHVTEEGPQLTEYTTATGRPAPQANKPTGGP